MQAPDLVFPPVLGQGTVTWSAVLSRIKQPDYLWDCWKPTRSLEQMSVHDIWSCYDAGEQVFDGSGNPTGVKPPLRLVEQTFKSRWRTLAAVCVFLTF